MSRTVLDNTAIYQLLKRPEVVQAFPFLAAAAAKVQTVKAGGCGRCARKQRQNAPDYDSIKQAIAAMDGAGKAQLKELLGAAEVRMIYKNQRSQVVRLTF